MSLFSVSKFGANVLLYKMGIVFAIFFLRREKYFFQVG